MESLHVISAYLAWICLPLGPIQPYFPYVNAAYLAWICHKHNSLPLGPIQPLYPSAKELLVLSLNRHRSIVIAS